MNDSTTRTEALAELIAKVEAGTWQHTDWPTVEKGFWGNWNEAALHFQSAYNGSLDAAKALHEAVLPGWIWGRQKNGAMWVAKRPYTFRATLPDNPARAWLLAILRALHSMEPDA